MLVKEKYHSEELFIKKNYSENSIIAQEFLDSKAFTPTDRFILIGAHLCPICQINF